MENIKLVYIFIGASKSASSVQNKVVSQINGLNLQIKTTGWFFSTEIEEETELSNNIKLLPLKKLEKRKRVFHNFYENVNYYKQVNNYLLNVPKVEDVYYFLRHGASNRQLFNIIENIGSKLFLYIPSHSLLENLREKQADKSAKSIGSKLFKWIEYYFYFKIWETKLWSHYLHKLKAVVVFTPEFGAILKKYSKKPLNYIYNRDGADVDKCNLREPKTSGPVKLLFMKGSSMQQPWSGLSRLVASIKQFPHLDIELFITGSMEDSFDESFVHQVGKLGKEELEELVNKVDLGVSNLANYLIDFNETTNLKSRDYYMRGLPFIQSNTMPDIEDHPLKEFYMLIPNNNSIIDMQEVVNFALNFRDKPNTSEKMRSLALNHLSWIQTSKELAESIVSKISN